jgi:hypothetical protein
MTICQINKSIRNNQRGDINFLRLDDETINNIFLCIFFSVISFCFLNC